MTATIHRTQVPSPVLTLQSHQQVLQAVLMRLREIAPTDALAALLSSTTPTEISAAIAAHVALADPHTQYLLESVVIAVAQLTNALPLLLHVRDEKAANTAGGTFTTGAWQTRTLNTEKTNEISGASLAANQITLPAGTYEIEAKAPALYVNRHKARLYNITDAADVLIGSSEYTAPATNAQTFSTVAGRFTLAAQKVLELQHRCQTTAATSGLGVESNLDSKVEVYAEVMIWKLPWL